MSPPARDHCTRSPDAPELDGSLSPRLTARRRRRHFPPARARLTGGIHYQKPPKPPAARPIGRRANKHGSRLSAAQIAGFAADKTHNWPQHQRRILSDAHWQFNLGGNGAEAQHGLDQGCQSQRHSGAKIEKTWTKFIGEKIELLSFIYGPNKPIN